MAQVFEVERKADNNKKTIERRSRKSFGASNRSATDKYWCLLFFFIFTLWTTFSYYAYYHYKPKSKYESVNNITTNNTIELAPFYLWGKSWLFDSVTCNLAHLDEHYNNSGSIVIWTNVLICILSIIYSLSSMPNDNIFHSPLGTACCIFLVFTLYHRFLMFRQTTLPAVIAPRYEKVCSWLMPEIIFIIVWYTKEAYTDDCHKRVWNEMRNFRKHRFLLCSCILMAYSLYCLLILITWEVVYKLSWDSPLFYAIIGGSCYVGLTIFYFWLMVVSCSVDINMDYDYDSEYEILDLDGFPTPGFMRALFIIGRYHFGTACYHATLIFPRLETFRVMNEPEFRKEVSFIRRFYEIHCKVHNLSLMSTAVGGTNHLESLRELLRHRLFNFAIPPRLEYFQGFNQIARSLTALLFSINSLMLITLWFYGLSDSRLSLATWAFYLRLMVVFKMAMRVSDAILDPTLLHLNTVPYTFDELFTQLFGDSLDEPIV